MSKESIRQKINELKTKIIELEKEFDEDENFIPCTKEQLFRKATSGYNEDHKLSGGYIISEIVLSNNISGYQRGNLEITVELVKHQENLLRCNPEKYTGMWIGGENPGIVLMGKSYYY